MQKKNIKMKNQLLHFSVFLCMELTSSLFRPLVQCVLCPWRCSGALLLSGALELVALNDCFVTCHPICIYPFPHSLSVLQQSLV